MADPQRRPRQYADNPFPETSPAGPVRVREYEDNPFPVAEPRTPPAPTGSAFDLSAGREELPPPPVRRPAPVAGIPLRQPPATPVQPGEPTFVPGGGLTRLSRPAVTPPPPPPPPPAPRAGYVPGAGLTEPPRAAAPEPASAATARSALGGEAALRAAQAAPRPPWGAPTAPDMSEYVWRQMGRSAGANPVLGAAGELAGVLDYPAMIVNRWRNLFRATEEGAPPPPPTTLERFIANVERAKQPFTEGMNEELDAAHPYLAGPARFAEGLPAFLARMEMTPGGRAMMEADPELLSESELLRVDPAWRFAGRAAQAGLMGAAKFGGFEGASAVAEGAPESEAAQRVNEAMKGGLELAGMFEVPGAARQSLGEYLRRRAYGKYFEPDVMIPPARYAEEAGRFAFEGADPRTGDRVFDPLTSQYRAAEDASRVARQEARARAERVARLKMAAAARARGPAPEPRFPALAAIKLDDGTIVTGQSHPAIMGNPAIAARAVEDGFVDERGVVAPGRPVPPEAWMSREEAGQAQAQLEGGSAQAARTEGLNQGRAPLERGGFTMADEERRVRMNQLRAEKGLPPFTRAQFRDRFRAGAKTQPAAAPAGPPLARYIVYDRDGQIYDAVETPERAEASAQRIGGTWQVDTSPSAARGAPTRVAPRPEPVREAPAAAAPEPEPEPAAAPGTLRDLAWRGAGAVGAGAVAAAATPGDTREKAAAGAAAALGGLFAPDLAERMPVGERGSIDIGSGKFFQRAVVAAEKMPWPKAPAQDIDNWIKKQPMPKDEYERVIRPVIEANAGKTLTRADFIAQVQANGIRLKETKYPIDNGWAVVHREDPSRLVAPVDENGFQIGHTFPSEQDARTALADHAQVNGENPADYDVMPAAAIAARSNAELGAVNQRASQTIERGLTDVEASERMQAQLRQELDDVQADWYKLHADRIQQMMPAAEAQAAHTGFAAELAPVQRRLVILKLAEAMADGELQAAGEFQRYFDIQREIEDRLMRAGNAGREARDSAHRFTQLANYHGEYAGEDWRNEISPQAREELTRIEQAVPGAAEALDELARTSERDAETRQRFPARARETRYPSYAEAEGDYGEQVVQLDTSARPGTPDTSVEGLVEAIEGRPRRVGDTGGYSSGHWPDVENPLGHVRRTLVEMPTGEKGLHIEELQSDWHEAGRERGYREPKSAKPPEPLQWQEGTVGPGVRATGRQWTVAVPHWSQELGEMGGPNLLITELGPRASQQIGEGIRTADLPKQYRFRGIDYDSLEEAKQAADTYVRGLDPGPFPDRLRQELTAITRRVNAATTQRTGELMPQAVEELRAEDPNWDSYSAEGRMQRAMQRARAIADAMPPDADLIARRDEINRAYEAWREQSDAYRERQSDYQSKPPDAPYKKTEEWMGLLFRRAVDEAVQKDLDWVTWAPGDVQEDRYGIAKKVGRLRWDPTTQRLRAYSHGGSPVFDDVVSRDRLPDYIGKAVTEKLLSSPRIGRPSDRVGRELESVTQELVQREPALGEPGALAHDDSWRQRHPDLAERVRVAAEPREGEPGDHVLEGDNLRVSKGTISTKYEKILPNVIRDWAKKRGIKVPIEEAPVPLKGDNDPERRADSASRRLEAQNDQPASVVLTGVAWGFDDGARSFEDALNRWMTEREAVGQLPPPDPAAIERARQAYEATKAAAVMRPGIRLTPELKAAIRERGQELGASTPEMMGRLAGAGVMAGVAAAATPGDKKTKAAAALAAGVFGFAATPAMLRAGRGEAGKIDLGAPRDVPSVFGDPMIAHEAVPGERQLMESIPKTKGLKAAELREARAELTRNVDRVLGNGRAVARALTRALGRPITVAQVEGTGLWQKIKNPNRLMTGMRFEDMKIAMALLGMAEHQDAQFGTMFTETRTPDAQRGVVIMGDKDGAPLSPADANKLLAALRKKGIEGATMVNENGHIQLVNVTGVSKLSDADFDRAWRSLDGQKGLPDHHVEDGYFRTEYQDGTADYGKALGQQPDLLREARALVRRTRQSYVEYARRVGGDAAAAEVRSRINAKLDALSNASRGVAQAAEQRAEAGARRTTTRGDNLETIYRSRTRGRTDLTNATPQARAAAALKYGVRDLREARRRFKNAERWYDPERAGTASAIARFLLPELRDPHKMGIFHAVLAVLSNGNDIRPNFADALHTMGSYLKGEGFQLGRGNLRQQSWVEGLDRLQQLIHAYGEEGAVKELDRTAEITRPRLGTYTEPEAVTTLGVNAQKVGRFYKNLRGDLDWAVIDRHMARMAAEWMGARWPGGLKPEKAALKLEALTPAHYREIEGWIREIARREGIEPAQAQAALWVLARDRYPQAARSLGAESASFHEAGTEALLGRKLYGREAERTLDKPPPFEEDEPYRRAAGERGATTPGTMAAIARTGVGAAAGAAVGAAAAGPDNRKKGALAGALAGGVAAAGAPWMIDKVAKSKIVDDINRHLAPALRSPEAAEGASILRAQLGHSALSNERVVQSFKTFRRVIGRLSLDQRWALIDAIENRSTDPATYAKLAPELRAFGDHVRRTLDGLRDQVRALGTGKLENFYEDYFPHIWKDPKEAANKIAAIMGRRPMEGPKSFLKQRTYVTFAEGKAAGLEPISDNPVDLVLLKAREMERYLMAHRTLAEMKDAGLLRYVASAEERGQARDDGYREIDDSVFRVFGPKHGAVGLPEGANIKPEDVTVYGRREMGSYWAPEPVAQVLHNYLRPGLAGQNALYDVYRSFGNVLNQAQLGLSAFHLGFTTVDAATSRMALAIRQLRGGNPLKALGTAASVPISPFTNIWRGHRLLSTALKGTGDPAMLRIAKALEEGGGRIRMDSYYQTDAGHKLLEMFRTGRGLAWMAGRAAAGAGVGALTAGGDKEKLPRDIALGTLAGAFGPAMLELASKPIMEFVVPRQKLGVFADLADYELSKLPPGTDMNGLEARQVLQRAWDSVDNRMGQLVYDNLFWNRTFKDLAMAGVRSVGWNLGTIRELGGGAADLARGKLSSRTDYLMALPVVVGLMGALWHRLATGKNPETLFDYYYPQNGKTDVDGNPDRVDLPSYVKDIFAYSKHPLQTLGHKVHPDIQMAIDLMFRNRDFYGDRIRNERDPVVVQAQQIANYITTQFVPFGIRNLQETRQREGTKAPTSAVGRLAAAAGLPTTKRELMPFVGVVPAPRDVVRSPAQNLMAEMLGEHRIEGNTPEARERANVMREIREVPGGKEFPTEDVQREMNRRDPSGGAMLVSNDINRALKEGAVPPLVRRFQLLSAPEAQEVWEIMTPQERALVAPIYSAKFASGLKSGRLTMPQ